MKRLIFVAESKMDKFPCWALQPKRETGAISFLSKNPSFDGRGIIIAIFDSGFFCSKVGLQICLFFFLTFAEAILLRLILLWLFF
jgi:hypothetical protein